VRTSAKRPADASRRILDDELDLRREEGREGWTGHVGLVAVQSLHKRCPVGANVHNDEALSVIDVFPASALDRLEGLAGDRARAVVACSDFGVDLDPRVGRNLVQRQLVPLNDLDAGGDDGVVLQGQVETRCSRRAFMSDIEIKWSIFRTPSHNRMSGMSA